MKATRAEAHAVIDGELDYQDRKWGATESGGRHENILEWLVYMKDYCEEAIHVMSRQAEPKATTFALYTARKVGALAVSAMMNCGALSREEEGARPIGFTEK